MDTRLPSLADEPDFDGSDFDGPDVGDPSQWIEQTVDSHQHRLLCYARGLLREPAAAQDAVQDTFLQLCRKVRQVASTPEPPSLAEFAQRVSPWLFTVCRTRVIDMQRKRTPEAFPRRDAAGDQDDYAETAIVDQRPQPDVVAETTDQHEQVSRCIHTLTARQQEVLQLRMQAGLSYREIANVTGLTTTNVGFHLHQAMNSLRQSLATA